MRKAKILLAVLLIVTFLLIVACACTSCAALSQYGSDPNNTVLIDPNQIDALIAAGKGVQTIGVAMGRPELIGLGLLVVTIGTAIGAAIVKK